MVRFVLGQNTSWIVGHRFVKYQTEPSRSKSQTELNQTTMIRLGSTRLRGSAWWCGFAIRLGGSVSQFDLVVWFHKNHTVCICTRKTWRGVDGEESMVRSDVREDWRSQQRRSRFSVSLFYRLRVERTWDTRVKSKDCKAFRILLEFIYSNPAKDIISLMINGQI